MMQEGDRVMHSTSGRGVILECSGMRARVQYDDGAVSWVELNDLVAPRIEVHNGVDLDAAYALLQQQLGATPACLRPGEGVGSAWGAAASAGFGASSRAGGKALGGRRLARSDGGASDSEVVDPRKKDVDYWLFCR